MKQVCVILATILLTLISTQYMWSYNTHTTYADEAQQTSIVITEIAAPEPSSLEWIEIQNIGNQAIDISNWKFFENDTNHGLTLFQGDATLRAEEIALIANKAEEIVNTYDLIDITIFDSSWGSLNQSGEEIGLKDAEGNFIELFTYLPHNENTLQRINLTSNDYTETNWIEEIATIGKENLNEIEIAPATPDTESATPEVAATQEVGTPQILPPQAIITIQSGVTKAEGKVTINLDGSNSIDPQEEKLTYYWDFGDGTTYENKNPRSKTYRETGTYLVTLRVTNESGLFNETTIQITVTSESEAPKIQQNTKSQQITTQSSEPKPTQETTPESVTPKTYPTLLLNEIFPNPEGKDTNQEWIEIYNPNDFAVNAKDYVLDDYTDSGSKPMTLKEIEISPKSYYLIFDPSINLNNSNEEIQLFDPNTTLLDKIYFSESKEGQSFARHENEWLWTMFPTPNFTNEIISENLELKDPQEKEKSEFQNGNLSSEIYISEILPNPKGEDAKGEWVELYNGSSTEVNLGNWVLDDNEKGSKPFTIPDTYVIKQKSYLVIERPETKISLDNRADTVRLFNYEEELQDEIAYEKAKENLSFAKVTVLHEDSTEIEWQWTPQITKTKPNPRLYKIRGEVEDKLNETIFIKAKELSLKEDNELNDMVLSPGNLVELTYDDTNQIKEYSLIREKTTVPTTHSKDLFIEAVKALTLFSIITLLFLRKRKKQVT